MQRSSKERKEDVVVISGMGPTAMATAWTAAQAGKSVVMISDRKKDEFSRPQRVSLNLESRRFLLDMLSRENVRSATDEDIKFAEALGSEDLSKVQTTFAISEVEQFLKRRLDAIRPPVTCHYESTLAKIDMKEGKASIRSLSDAKAPETTFGFTYLVGADGAKHHAADILNQSRKEKGAKDDAITFKAASGAPEHQYHGSIYATIERKDSNLKLPEKRFLSNTKDSKDDPALMWAVSFNPARQDAKSVECNFGCELPKNLSDRIQHYNNLTDVKQKAAEGPALKKDVEEFLQAMVNEHPELRKLNEGKLTVSLAGVKEGKESKLKLQTFTVTNLQANTARVRREDKERGDTYFLLSGDAYRTPNYQLGHGLNDGLQHAQWLGQVFNRSLSTSTYDDNCKEQAARISRYGVVKNLAISNSFWAGFVERRAESIRTDSARELGPHLSRYLEDFKRYRSGIAATVTIHDAAAIQHRLNSEAKIFGEFHLDTHGLTPSFLVPPPSGGTSGTVSSRSPSPTSAKTMSVGGAAIRPSTPSTVKTSPSASPASSVPSSASPSPTPPAGKEEDEGEGKNASKKILVGGIRIGRGGQ